MSRAPDKATLMQLLAVGKGRLGWDEALYRGFLAKHGATAIDGRVSAKTMTTDELDAALAEMRDAGFEKKPRALHDWREPRLQKLSALWMAGHDGGVINNPNPEALAAFCKRFTGVDRLDWASTEALNKSIEGLKKMLVRNGLKLDQNGELRG